MKSTILFLLIYGFLPDKLYAQAKKNDTILIKMIDTMFKDDQFWRKEYMKVSKNENQFIARKLLKPGGKPATV